MQKPSYPPRSFHKQTSKEHFDVIRARHQTISMTIRLDALEERKKHTVAPIVCLAREPPRAVYGEPLRRAHGRLACPAASRQSPAPSGPGARKAPHPRWASTTRGSLSDLSGLPAVSSLPREQASRDLLRYKALFKAF